MIKLSKVIRENLGCPERKMFCHMQRKLYKIISCLLSSNLADRMKWDKILKVLKEKSNKKKVIPYQAKVSFKMMNNLRLSQINKITGFHQSESFRLEKRQNSRQFLIDVNI